MLRLLSLKMAVSPSVELASVTSPIPSFTKLLPKYEAVNFNWSVNGVAILSWSTGPVEGSNLPQTHLPK